MHRITATFRHPETGAEFTAHFGGDRDVIRPVFQRLDDDLHERGWWAVSINAAAGFETTGETVK